MISPLRPTAGGNRQQYSLSPGGPVLEDAVPGSLLEAFGGFYKQLVQGTKCTGPDALAGNERFVEIDLSGEFPPERREAQVDPQATPLQVGHSAYHGHHCGLPQSLHHL